MAYNNQIARLNVYKLLEISNEEWQIKICWAFDVWMRWYKTSSKKMHSNITNEIIIMGVLFSGAWSNFVREKQKKRKTNLGPKTCICMNRQRKHATLP